MTGRHRATIAREISEAEKIGDDIMKKIVGTSLDRQSEITALAAMDEHEGSGSGGLGDISTW